MLSGLIFTAFLMGVGGIPHCTVMCGAPCAAVLRQPLPLSALLGRCLGYAALGGLAAASTSLAAAWARQSAVLQPLWLLLQLGALVLGLYVVATARMPAALDQQAQALYRRVQGRLASIRWMATQPLLVALAPMLAGMAWAALPCGLLYGAVMVAALANGPLEGALVMSAFAIPSAVGLWAAPWLMRRFAIGEPRAAAASVPIMWTTGSATLNAGHELQARLPLMPKSARKANVGAAARWGNPAWAVRLAGLTLALMSAWAVYHRLLDQWRIWCG